MYDMGTIKRQIHPTRIFLSNLIAESEISRLSEDIRGNTRNILDIPSIARDFRHYYVTLSTRIPEIN